MDFSAIIGITSTTTTKVKGKFFYKNYYNISDEHWERIKSSSIHLSEEKIGPKVISVCEYDNKRTIKYEKIIPFNLVSLPEDLKLSIEEIKRKIDFLVHRLHFWGYGHGDLHIGNLGYKNNNIYILDHDTVYKTTESPPEWLLKWMEIGFEWEDSFEEFVENDYYAWKTDWLSDQECRRHRLS